MNTGLQAEWEDDSLFPKATVDTVCIVMTCHHLSQPVGLLKNVTQSLEPGATVVVVDSVKAKE